MDQNSIDLHLSMWNPAVRKKSFKKWPFNSKSSCSVAKMVSAGFYHVPDPDEKDTARCFFCCRTICGFEEGDDPVEEHLRRSKDCKYSDYGKDLQASTTLYEYAEIEKERRNNYISFIQDDKDKVEGSENFPHPKRVRLSLTRNSCLTFSPNSSWDNPAPHEASRAPLKSALKSSPLPLINNTDKEISDPGGNEVSDLAKRIVL